MHLGVVGLGTATWGRGTDREEAADQVGLLLDAGGNLIDIAAGGPASDFARQSLADPGVRREAIVNVRLSADNAQRGLIAALDEAIEAMGIGHADIWTVEGWAPHSPWQEIVTSFAVAVSTGRARYAGICPGAPWQAALVGAALDSQPDRSTLAVITTALNLLDHAAARPMRDVAAALGAGIFAAWPLAGGVLTGKYRHATPPDSRGAGERYAARMHAYRSASSWPIVDGLCAAAEGLGASPGAIALAWVRDQPGVTSSLVGARTPHQWRAALASTEVTLPPEIRLALDEVADGASHLSHDGTTGAVPA